MWAEARCGGGRGRSVLTLYAGASRRLGSRGREGEACVGSCLGARETHVEDEAGEKGGEEKPRQQQCANPRILSPRVKHGRTCCSQGRSRHHGEPPLFQGCDPPPPRATPPRASAVDPFHPLMCRSARRCKHLTTPRSRRAAPAAPVGPPQPAHLPPHSSSFPRDFGHPSTLGDPESWISPSIAPRPPLTIPPSAFTEVPNSERPNLFVRKLRLCSIICDFAEGAGNDRDKEIKRQVRRRPSSSLSPPPPLGAPNLPSPFTRGSLSGNACTLAPRHLPRRYGESCQREERRGERGWEVESPCMCLCGAFGWETCSDAADTPSDSPRASRLREQRQATLCRGDHARGRQHGNSHHSYLHLP